jgi:hypothetical protein
VSSFYPFEPEISVPEEIMEKLRSDGIIVFPNFISDDQVADINQYFENKIGSNAHVPNAGDSQPYVFSEDYAFPMLSYTPYLSLNCKEIKSLVTNHLLTSIAKNYLNCYPTLYSVNTYRTFPNLDYATHSPHRDFDDYKFMVCFVYLTDVEDNDDGPLIYWPGTHLRGGTSGGAVPVTG